MRPHRWQPTRLPRPWDSPGKNTGVGCHFLLQCRKVKSESEVAQSCPTLSEPMYRSPPKLLRPWDFPGKSTGVRCHCWWKKNGGKYFFIICCLPSGIKIRFLLAWNFLCSCLYPSRQESHNASHSTGNSVSSAFFPCQNRAYLRATPQLGLLVGCLLGHPVSGLLFYGCFGSSPPVPIS